MTKVKSTPPENTKKLSFNKQHQKWTDAIRLIENLALNSVDADKD